MSESIMIKGELGATAFVDRWDNGAVWLAVHIHNGSASIVLPREQAQELLAALTKVLG